MFPKYFCSVSLDASNSEEEHGESTGHSESHKSDSEEIDAVEIDDDEHGQIMVDNNGPPPCKLARYYCETLSPPWETNICFCFTGNK